LHLQEKRKSCAPLDRVARKGGAEAGGPKVPGQRKVPSGEKKEGKKGGWSTAQQDLEKENKNRKRRKSVAAASAERKRKKRNA